MKFLIAPAYILFITAGLVTSQKCPPCPAFAVGGGLAVIAGRLVLWQIYSMFLFINIDMKYELSLFIESMYNDKL